MKITSYFDNPKRSPLPWFLLLYDRNIIGSSSEIFGFLILWAIFGHFRKMFGNVCLVFGQLLGNFRKSWENRQKVAISMSL